METFTSKALLRVVLVAGLLVAATAVMAAASAGTFSDEPGPGGPAAGAALGLGGDEAGAGARASRGGEGWGSGGAGEGDVRVVGAGGARGAGATCVGSRCREARRGAAGSGPGERDGAAEAGLSTLIHAWLRPGDGSGSARRRSSAPRSGADDAQEEEPDEPEYGSVGRYLADSDERPDEVRDLAAILGDPSNVVADQDRTALLAWDARDREPRGSYLYVLEQDGESRLEQVHRYFCPERRLDVLAETCVPIASVYSDSGAPVAVGYSREGAPQERRVDDLDPSLFSNGRDYTEADELLLYLQEYFDALRG